MHATCACAPCRLPHNVVSLHVLGNRIYVGDAQESVHFMKVGDSLARSSYQVIKS